MRFDLLEVAVSECPEIEPRKQGHYNEYREEYFQLSQELLPEYTCISEIAEPHPVSDEAYHHEQEADDDGYQHDYDGQTLAASPAFALEFDLFVSVYVFLSAECHFFSPPFYVKKCLKLLFNAPLQTITATASGCRCK